MPKPSLYYRPPVRAKNNRGSSMGRIDDKLNNIFKDDDADEILGPLKTKTPVRRAPNTQIEKNFAEVVAFFEEHGRLPEEGSDDGAETGLWAKFDGIRIRGDFRAQVALMDTHGLLDMTVDEDCSHVFEADVPDVDFNEIAAKTTPTYIVSSEDTLSEAQDAYENKLRAIDDECKADILNLQQEAIKPLREALSKITHGMSVEVFNLEGFEYTGENVVKRLNTTADALVETATKLQSLAENMGEAVGHIEKEIAGYLVRAQLNKENVAKPVLVKNTYPDGPKTEVGDKQEPVGEKMSLDDILGDDDFDDLLDGNEGGDSDSILGGRRAIKAHERENVDQTNREPCPSFENYRERFEQYKQAMEDGKLVVSANRSETLSSGDLFLWDGFIALLSGESIKGDVKEHSGKRLHVVFSNGTEAWLREGSIKRSMYAYTDRGNKVVCKRLVPVSKDLFTADDSGTAEENTVTGYIYIVRTLSKDPSLTKIRKSAVKIGVTKNPVAVRVANAEKDPTFLCAPVDIIHTFTLHNLNPRKVEETLHAFFGEVRLRISAKDRFGNDVTANEWFLVSPKIVEKAIKSLVENSLNNLSFNKVDGKIHHKQIADKDSYI